MVSQIQQISYTNPKIQPTDGDMSFYYNKKGNLDELMEIYVDHTLADRLRRFEKPTGMIPNQLGSKRK